MREIEQQRAPQKCDSDTKEARQGHEKGTKRVRKGHGLGTVCTGGKTATILFHSTCAAEKKLFPRQPLFMSHGLSGPSNCKTNPPPPRTASSQDLLHHVPMHIRQPEVPPRVPVRELLMIEPKQMQDRRMEV